VRLILDHLRGALTPAAYIPIDISAEQLHRVATEIAAAYPSLPVLPVAADYTDAVELPPVSFVSRPAPRRVGFFPGSTIGNLHPPDARAFLHRIAQTCGPGGGLLLGADLKKDPEVLHAAYNDAGGITAAFNRNVLVRLNRELGATFDPACFRHYAYYNPIAGRVEMHLVSLGAQTVQVAGECVSFERGESIWTESSYKYTIHELGLLAAHSGFEVARVWTDPCRWFAVLYLVVVGREAGCGDLGPRPEGRAG
jgi:dimethylhistidine N-methyltransferase